MHVQSSVMTENIFSFRREKKHENLSISSILLIMRNRRVFMKPLEGAPLRQHMRRERRKKSNKVKNFHIIKYSTQKLEFYDHLHTRNEIDMAHIQCESLTLTTITIFFLAIGTGFTFFVRVLL